VSPAVQQPAKKELDAGLAALSEIEAFDVAEETAFFENIDRQRHMIYLWIVVGSRLKNYCSLRGIGRASGHLGRAIALRDKLAYSDPAHVAPSIVWTTRAVGPRCRARSPPRLSPDTSDDVRSCARTGRLGARSLGSLLSPAQ
jgi:hypothetical protein